jgi:Sec-independent protein translocase protein TatA
LEFLVGNFGVTEILIVLGLIVALFGIPRRSKLRRKATDRLGKSKDAVGAVKDEFLSGLREEPETTAAGKPGVVQTDAGERAWWRRRSR